MAPWQTPTTVTQRILAAAAGHGSTIEQDLEALDLLEEWVLAECGPEPLKGKDARNPYLAARRDEEIGAIKSRIEQLRAGVRAAGGRARLVGSG